MRAVLDTNVLVSAAISPRGAPAELIRRWRLGAFELIVSPGLLEDLGRALAYPKIARLIDSETANEVIATIREQALELPDPDHSPPVRSTDPDDDYLLALASDAGAALVTGDKALLALAENLPILSSAEFLAGLVPPGS